MLVGPLIFLVLAAVVVMFDPLLILGDDEPRHTAPQSPAPDRYAPRQTPAAAPYGSADGWAGAADENAPHAGHR